MDTIDDEMDIKLECQPEIGSTELTFEDINLQASVQTKSIAIWSNEETKKLIDLYKKFMTDIGPFNRFKRKKDMWCEISAHIPTKSAKQAEERLKTILRRKKKGIIEKVYLSNTKRKLMDLEAEGENELSIIRKQKISLKSDECITTYRSIQVWSNNETKLLVELYKNFINDVGPQKRFEHKKDMWDQISANFENKDPRQCEQRFNTILRRKKPITTKSFITKTRRKMVDFRPRQMEVRPKKTNVVDEVEDEDEEEEEGEVDDEDDGEVDGDVEGEVEDDIVIENGVNPQEKEQCNEQSKTIAQNMDVITEECSIIQTLVKIATKKEEGKERRHRERMEAMAKMQFILQQIMIKKMK